MYYYLLLKVNTSASCIHLDGFKFKQFNVDLPHKIEATVTERIKYDVYWMRDEAILSKVFEVSM